MTDSKECTLVVTHHEKMDVDAAMELEEEISQLLELGKNRIVVDCKSIKWINSFGIGTLASIQKKIQAHSGEYHLIGLSEEVVQLLKTVRLNKVISIHQKM